MKQIIVTSLRRGNTFLVGIKAIKRLKKDNVLERIIGKVVLKKIRGVRVKLKDPDVSFFGAVSGNVFILGKRMVKPFRNFL